MRAFITGITGFAGSHLAENLLQHGIEVAGTSLKGESQRNLAAIRGQVRVYQSSLAEQPRLRKAIRDFRPDWVFHLAALAAVGRSFTEPVETMQVNLIGTQCLFEILRKAQGVRAIVFVSSADVYGPLPPQKMPIKPDYALQPVSPYGASKAAADILAYLYFRAFGLPIVRIRAFNHTGPRQNRGYFVPDFCAQIANIEKTRKRGIIKVGDLSAKRDLADVRDIVDGYRLAAKRGRPGEAYILATGRARSIGDYLQLLTSLSTADVKVKTERSLIRPVEVPLLIGSISKARKELGFRPSYSIKQTLSDTLEYWRRN